MATREELDILDRLLNPDKKEDELLQSRGIPADTPLNLEEPVTDEEVGVSAANNVVEAFNAPRGIDRQVAGDIAKSPMAREAKQMADPKLAENLQDLQSGADETLSGATTPDTPSEREQILQQYRDLIAQQQKLMEKPRATETDDDKAMQWLTAAGQVASQLTPRHLPQFKVTPWAGEMKRRQNAQELERKARLGELEGLQKAMQGYLTAEGKGKKEGLSARDEAYLEYYNKKLGLQEQQLEKQLKAEERLQDKFGYQKVEKFQKDARDALQDLRKTDTWKTGEASLAEIETIENLLDDAYREGGQSLAMLGPKIAKGIAGEVGVLTEQDVKRYIQNPQIAESLMDTIARVKEGKLTEASYDNLKRLMEISKKTARNKIDRALDREAILLSRRENIPYEDARYYLDNQFQKEVVDRKQEYTERTLKGKEAGIDREKVRVRLPDGRVGKIDGSKIESFKRKFPNAEILD